MESNFTKHTEMLSLLTEIGHKLGFKVFIGKREQSEKYGDKSLSQLQDFTDISFLKLDKDKSDRISMIDML
jgi:hypothetical protein